MDTLDKPSLPDPASTPNRHIALRYGAIWAGVSIAITLVGFITGNEPSMPDSSTAVKVGFWLIATAVSVWAIAGAIKEDRDKQLGGFITLGRGLGLGTLAAFISSALNAVFSILYMTVINPGFQDQMKEAMTSQYEKQGMNEEQIEMAISIAEKFTSPGVMFVSALIMGTLIGAVISLIVAAIMKRDPFKA